MKKREIKKNMGKKKALAIAMALAVGTTYAMPVAAFADVAGIETQVIEPKITESFLG